MSHARSQFFSGRAYEYVYSPAYVRFCLFVVFRLYCYIALCYCSLKNHA